MAELTIQQAFDLAVQHHQAGRLQDAESIYRQILTVQPTHATAIHHLGLIALQVGQKQVAANLIRRSIAIDPNCAEAYNNLGNALVDLEQSDEAISCYQKAISIKSDFAAAHSNLGAALKDRGELPDAISAYRKAIQHQPDLTEAHYNLGDALMSLGKLDEAIAAYRESLRLSPEYAEAHNNLGHALHLKGILDQAEVSIKLAISFRPDFPEAMCSLGIVLCDQGKLDEAFDAYQKALLLRPEYAEAHSNLGSLLLRQGKTGDAIAACRQAILMRPAFAEAHCNLGSIYVSTKELPQAIACFRQAVAIKENFFEAHYNLANALNDAGDLGQALIAAERAVSLDPSHADALNTTGNILKASGRPDEAIAMYRRAIGTRPGFADAYNGLSNALKETGQLDDAIAANRQAIALDPASPDFHSNLILNLHYQPSANARILADEESTWNQLHAQPLQSTHRPHTNDPDPHRRLRIGYVSPDFQRHAVGQNILPLFQHHDHERFEITCYSNGNRPDVMTRQFQQLADHWRDIAPLSDEQAAEMIRSDAIDILVDLALHTARNRLRLFARKPAPVQATFAGYPGSTGLSAIDYRLSDPYLDPPGMDESIYSETTVRLPHSFWCFQPFENSDLTVSRLPALENGQITFACLGNFYKVNDPMLLVWMKVLQKVPRSQLMLLASDGNHRLAVLDRVAAGGIDSRRIEFISRQTRRAYLELYQRVDIGLDSFPYNGHTTSLDSLWMGVPVVTLVGQIAVSRAGYCQLSNLGMTELAAQSPEEFVEIAVKLAQNLPHLAQLRAGLRAQMENAPLMNAAAFARSIEGAYQNMWLNWCRSYLAHR